MMWWETSSRMCSSSATWASSPWIRGPVARSIGELVRLVDAALRLCLGIGFGAQVDALEPRRHLRR